jgi:hypothetical protein
MGSGPLELGPLVFALWVCSPWVFAARVFAPWVFTQGVFGVAKGSPLG